VITGNSRAIPAGLIWRSPRVPGTAPNGGYLRVSPAAPSDGVPASFAARPSVGGPPARKAPPPVRCVTGTAPAAAGVSWAAGTRDRAALMTSDRDVAAGSPADGTDVEGGGVIRLSGTWRPRLTGAARRSWSSRPRCPQGSSSYIAMMFMPGFSAILEGKKRLRAVDLAARGRRGDRYGQDGTRRET